MMHSVAVTQGLVTIPPSGGEGVVASPCGSPAEFTRCKFIYLSGMFNEMKLISPCCLKYVVIT